MPRMLPWKRREAFRLAGCESAVRWSCGLSTTVRDCQTRQICLCLSSLPSPGVPALASFSAARSPKLMAGNRSEEHTSELQSLRHLVCRLLLEKKNTHSKDDMHST